MLSDEMTRHSRLWLVEWEEVWRHHNGETYRREVHEEHLVAPTYNELVDFLENRCRYLESKALSEWESTVKGWVAVQDEYGKISEPASPGYCRLGEISLLKKKMQVVLT